MELIHGGDVTGYRMRYGRPPVDFSASLNPLGMPPGVREAALRAVADATPYPDPLCRELTAALAARLGVPERFVLCGNGAADIIFRFVQSEKPRIAIVPAPTFAEYEGALRTIHCAIRYHCLGKANGFALDANIVEKITPEVGVIFLCQPNNPTGRLIEPALLAAVLERCAATGTVLFVDECFVPFLDEPAKNSLIRKIESFDNLFILGSFTKLYGMAGLRLGYGVSGSPGLIERLAAAGPPWAVSTVAQAAGLAALAETEFVEHTLRLVRDGKKQLLDGLARFGIAVIGSDANYIFFHSGIPDLDRKLMDAGILIRNCGNFRGLEPGYYRIAVKAREENDMLLRAIGAIMNG